MLHCAESCTLVEGAVREDGVAEFKGPAVHGLVRFAQVNNQEARIEAEFDGLDPGKLHSCSVNEYGDLREGAASTGRTYSPFLIGSLAPTVILPLLPHDNAMATDDQHAMQSIRLSVA